MERPQITEDQREMAVVLLANAIRKDAHLRNRAHDASTQDGFLHAGMTRRRAELAQRYIEGMRDLLRVLFPNGYAVAEECLEEAYALALGTPTGGTTNGHGTTYN
jgi:uncharacterized protein (DUF952 family)